MPFSSGTYSLYSTGNPVVTGTTVSSTWANNTLQDIASNGLSLCVLKDGTQTMTANLPMSNFKITGLGTATARTDAASAGSVQDGTAVYLTSVGGTTTAYTATAAYTMTAYATGQTFWFLPNATNTGATTIAINGIASPKNILSGGSACVGGELVLNVPAIIQYDGTQFNLRPSYTQTSFTGTLTGCTTTPTYVMNYVKVGNAVTLEMATSGFTGTSNATSKTITGMPAIIRPATGKVKLFYFAMSDNGGGFTLCNASIADTGVITFGNALTGGGTSWTNSGTFATAGGATVAYSTA